MKVAAKTFTLELSSIKGKSIDDFKAEIVFPKLSARSEVIFVIFDIKLLVEKIINKHCQ